MPDAVRRIYTYCKHMESCLVEMSPLLTPLFQVDVDTQKSMYHPRMIRRVVRISDTDSVIFTTQSIVEWYCGKVCFDQASYEISMFTVWLISQSLEHTFARLSTGFGMIGDDIYKISMKNEFFNPVMLTTHASKHYAGIQAIKEGKRLPKLKDDIKGVNFRGSALCAETNRKAKEFLLWVLETVLDKVELKASETLGRVAQHEKDIYDSLMSGIPTYLKRASIKHEGDYKDAMKSNYAYYHFWNEVWSHRYGPFNIPNKGYEIPLRLKGNILRDPTWLEQLRAHDSMCHDRLVAYLQNPENRKPTRIILPPTVDRIPEIMHPLIDFRSVILTNGGPFYLALQALGLGNVSTKSGNIVSDFYALDGSTLYQ